MQLDHHRHTLARLAATLILLASACSGGTSGSSGEPSQSNVPDSFDERAVLICPFYLACTPNDTDPLTASDCFRKFVDDDDATFLGDNHEREQRELVDCLADATTCADYDRCIAGDQPASCSGPDHCEGDVLVECATLSDGSSARVEKNCADRGLTCIEPNSEGALCGLAGVSCPDAEMGCSGDYMLWCPRDYQNAPIVTNCAAQGLSCQSPGLCAPANATTCTEETCDGSKAIHCLGGVPVVSDCAKLDPDYTCLEQGSDVTCGIPQDQQECDNQPPYSTCDGDIATACHDHKIFEIDCTRVGATCADTDLGATCTFTGQ